MTVSLNFFELAVAVAISLFGLSSGRPCDGGDVLTEFASASLVHIAKTRHWFE